MRTGTGLHTSFFARLALTSLLAFVSHCARTECRLNSECGEHSRCSANLCVSDCFADRDCPHTAPFCNDNGQCVAMVPTDAGADARVDAGADVQTADTVVAMDVPPSIDVPVAPDVPVSPDAPFTPDVPPPPPDVPTHGTGAYLDSCTASADCASGRCTAGTPRFCTQSCASDGDCADGQLCARGQCELDDTGRAGCDPSTGAPCQQYCVGQPGSATHCTRECASGGDCPAGFACVAYGARHVCVDIERPCSAASQCPSGLGFCGGTGDGCTATCASASDCPARLPGLPPYTCESVSGQQVCVPPSDVMGSDPLGATCSASGINTCRSGACDDGTTPNMCNQRCTPRAGCPSGFGCAPVPNGSDVLYACNRAAGRAWVNDHCSAASDCVTGLCRNDGNYCTRLCNDGFCPTGMHCMDLGLRSVDGLPVRFCLR